MYTSSSIAPEILTRQIIVLNERRIHPQAINIIPLHFTRKRRKARLHRAPHTVDAIRRNSHARIEQPYHVVAALAICKCGLIGDVFEHIEWERCVVCREAKLRVYARVRRGGFCAENSRVLGAGKRAVGVARGIKTGGEDIGAVGHCACERDFVARCHEHRGRPFKGCAVVAEEVEEGEFNAGALGEIGLVMVCWRAWGGKAYREIGNQVSECLDFVVVECLYDSRVHVLGESREEGPICVL
jgi:hypothetical protein